MALALDGARLCHGFELCGDGKNRKENRKSESVMTPLLIGIQSRVQTRHVEVDNRAKYNQVSHFTRALLQEKHELHHRYQFAIQKYNWT
jgi:hypothetical protein